MKKVKIIGTAGAIILALSLAANVFLGTQYAKYMDACRHDSSETMRVVRSFEGIYEKVAQIAEGGSIEKASLAWLQEAVAQTCLKFQNYGTARGMERGEAEEEYGIFAKFMDLKNIVFKIQDGDNIPEGIFEAIERCRYVEYLKRLSDISGDFLEERADSQIGPNDGRDFWKYYMDHIRE